MAGPSAPLRVNEHNGQAQGEFLCHSKQLLYYKVKINQVKFENNSRKFKCCACMRIGWLKRRKLPRPENRRVAAPENRPLFGLCPARHKSKLGTITTICDVGHRALFDLAQTAGVGGSNFDPKGGPP